MRLLIFVRCHTLPEFVLDTIDSIESFSETNPKIVVTVDYKEEVAKRIREARPDLQVFRSSEICGWGAGMYRLFAEALNWYIESNGFDFDFLLNMDYDLIFTEKGADVLLLRNTERNSRAGLWGKHVLNGAYWQLKMKRAMPKLFRMLSKMGIPLPFRYRVGEHVAGACSLLSRACIEKLYRLGFTESEPKMAGYSLGLADDPLLSFYVCACGFEMSGLDERAHIVWRETDYKRWAGKCYLYHPTKLQPGSGNWSVEVERECRNFFRRLRGKEDLPPMFGKAGPLAVRA